MCYMQVLLKHLHFPTQLGELFIFCENICHLHTISIFFAGFGFCALKKPIMVLRFFCNNLMHWKRGNKSRGLFVRQLAWWGRDVRYTQEKNCWMSRSDNFAVMRFLPPLVDMSFFLTEINRVKLQWPFYQNRLVSQGSTLLAPAALWAGLTVLITTLVDISASHQHI